MSALLADQAMRTKLRRALLRWYRGHARDLPWRRTRDPYRIWLSEIMLQQTQVATVIGYYERFLGRFETVHDLAAAPLDTVLKLWEGLGYYSRARNLHRCAQVVVEKHDGVFPQTAADLEKLPGIGRYTAAAIASIAFERPAAVLDGNVKRVVARLLRIEASIDERGTTDDLWEAADVLLPRQQAGDFNQAMMELGARICIPRQPQCLVCPVAGLCGARAAGVEQSLPRRSQKKPIPEIRAFAALVERDGRFLVARRPERGLLGGMWELPTVEEGDVDAGRRALRRLVGDLIGPIQLGAPIADVTHAYTHRRVQLTLLRATAVSPTVDRRPAAEQRWLNAREIDELAFGKLYHKALAAAGVKPLAREKSAH